jgi:hypothetical protein
MKTAVIFVLIVIAWVALNVLALGIDFVSETYGDIIGPLAIFGGLTALSIYALKGK